MFLNTIFPFKKYRGTFPFYVKEIQEIILFIIIFLLCMCVYETKWGKKKDLTKFKKRVAENFLFFISSVFLKTHFDRKRLTCITTPCSK